ncbi:hypothetical protein JCM10908_000656 [Rhodotorula pacifica]|uniref:uncharacterized protein n=1 Tax=Rhodotorula pacifica TaxID=1495444 RepID=UPI00317DE245
MYSQLIGPFSNAEAEEFFNRHKPSSCIEVPTGWYWVRLPFEGAKNKKRLTHDEPGSDSEEEKSFLSEGLELVERLTNRCNEIKETAPPRANKAKGIRSQKDLREEQHAQFNDGVKKLAEKYGILSGKWLFYGSQESIDITWSKIVKALVVDGGVLAETGVVHTAKVSCTPGDGGTWVICVYCDNSWDREAVGKVFKVLVEDLNLVSGAYKCDANTLLGIDSKHASQIRSSLWVKYDFMTKQEIDESLARASKAKVAPKKTLEQEVKSGAATGFDPVSDSEDDKAVRKKAKKA